MTSQAVHSFPRYGEVWMVRFGPVTGAEIGKTRPALIVSNDLNNERAATVTVLPITSAPAKRRYLDEVAVPRGTAGLKLDSRIKANMIRTVDKVRLTTLVGPIPESLYEQVNRALRLHLNVPG